MNDQEANTTLDRSNVHYTEGLKIDDWFKVAEKDYLELVNLLDWEALFNKYSREVKLLDIGCGTGRFPTMLSSKINPKKDILYDIVDTSEFCLSHVEKTIKPPFKFNSKFHLSVEKLNEIKSKYDIAWCVHSLYTLNSSSINSALKSLSNVLDSNGLALIFIASKSSFYYSFYEIYRTKIHNQNSLIPLCSSEDIITSLNSLGINHQIKKLNFEHKIKKTDRNVLANYLSGCTYMSHNLDLWQKEPEAMKFIDSFIKDDYYVFPQEVWLVSFGQTNI